MRKESREPAGILGRIAAPAVGVVGGLAFVALFFTRLQALVDTTIRDSGSALGDLSMYWSAFQVVHAGGNPYDAAQLAALLDGLGIHDPTVLYCMPSLFLLLYPVLHLPYPVAAAAWTILNVGFLLATLLLGWKLFLRGPVQMGPVAAAAISFLPFLALFKCGQISLAVTAVFLVGLALYTAAWSFAAGLVMSAALLKPHLFWTAFGALGLVSLREKRFGFPAGIAAGVLLQAAGVYALFPGLPGQWLAARNEPLQWLCVSTLAALRYGLFVITGRDFGVALLAVPALGLLGTAWWALARANPRELNRHVPLLLAVSVLSSPYLWIFDASILAPLYLMLWVRALSPGPASPLAIASVVALVAGAGTLIAVDRLDFPSVFYLMLLATAWTTVERRAERA